MKDTSVNLPPMTPRLEEFAVELEAYGFMLSSYTDYHCEPDDRDVTDFAVAWPSGSKLLKSTHYVARIDSTYRRPHVYNLRTFEGGRLKQKLKLGGYIRLLAGFGDRLEEAGIPRVRLGEYLTLILSWNHLTDQRPTPETVFDAMRLPLDTFDRAQVVKHGSDMIPEMLRYVNMSQEVFEGLFHLESLREKEIVYKSMKKHGLVGKMS